MSVSKSDVISLVENNEIVWHQRFELTQGVWTPGPNDIPWLFQTVGVPVDLTGKTVLDIGTSNGGAAFLAERRGASHVVAVDVCDENWFGFASIKELLGSKVEFISASLYELPEIVREKFDLVFCFGVLYHLRHPLLGLDNLRILTREKVWIESAVVDSLVAVPNEPLAYYNRHDRFKNDVTNWFIPTFRCLTDWCASAGLEPIDKVKWPEEAPARAVISCHPVEPEYLTKSPCEWVNMGRDLTFRNSRK